jgi:DNA-binding PucR family transcriptional regulator
MHELMDHAAAAGRGRAGLVSALVADTVPIRIGHEVVGIVAALGQGPLAPDQRAWLEAAAAAAAVTALMRDSQAGDLEGSRRALLQALSAGAPADVSAMVTQARRLGVELAGGAVALCAHQGEPSESRFPQLPPHPGALLADVGGGRVLALVPHSAGAGAGSLVRELVAELSGLGMRVAVSTPRTGPSAIHEALREAELLIELAASPDAILSGQEETYRLLIGVLLRNPEQLESLQESTISALGAYDAEHDAELTATLQAFLAHHGSTTETAEAMHLHRHTVGYRLTRVQEISGLSPYETDGRERLGLGLKAREILAADRRRKQRE